MSAFSRGVLREWLLPSRTMRRRLWPPLIGLAYIAAVGLLGGLRSDHVLVGLLGFLDLYNEKSRLFLKVFLPFALTGVVFDSMRYFYWQGIAGRVHVLGPYLFEQAAFGVDGLDIAPWLERVAKSKDDLEYFEICAEYVATFRDSHTAFLLPSDYQARLPITVDDYDGKIDIRSELNKGTEIVITLPVREQPKH